VRRALPLLGFLVVVAGVVALRPDDGGDGTARRPSEGRVLRVVDGDTIHVRVGGRDERVRYIGIDTPEEVKPGTPVQCYARAAAAANRRLVAGQEVRLVPDVEARDRYGRLLAYVYRAGDGRFVNAELVRDGFARPLTIPPNVRYAERLAGLAAQAREARRGLWAACAG
jgi:micrococcal nuclease